MVQTLVKESIRITQIFLFWFSFCKFNGSSLFFDTSSEFNRNILRGELKDHYTRMLAKYLDVELFGLLLISLTFIIIF